MIDATDRSPSIKSAAWQEEFIDRLLIMWAGMGALAVLVSISRANFTGWLPIYSAQIALIAMTLALTFFRSRFSATFKAACAISFNLAVGTSGVYFLGLLSGAPSIDAVVHQPRQEQSRNQKDTGGRGQPGHRPCAPHRDITVAPGPGGGGDDG